MSVRSARYNLLSLRNPKGLTVIPEERDAWAFLDAAAITSSRQQRAVIELVRGLKHAQLWSKMKAIYPFVGGTATTHKYNLKDPRDADAAFRLSFSGGWTHSSTGVLPNGTNAYADTFLTPSTNSNSTDSSLSFYSRNDSRSGVQIEMGVFTGANTLIFQLRPAVNFIANGLLSLLNFTTTSDSKGYWIGSKRADNDREVYLNGTSQASSSTNDVSARPSHKTFIGARSFENSAEFFSSKECAFATIGDGLTDSDATNLYNIVQRFQTSLGRQV